MLQYYRFTSISVLTLLNLHLHYFTLFSLTQQQVKAAAVKPVSQQVNSDGATSEGNAEKLMHLLKETLNELKEQ